VAAATPELAAANLNGQILAGVIGWNATRGRNMISGLGAAINVSTD
jgi:hypothetical protein